MKLSIIIPVYNEEKTIAVVLKRLDNIQFAGVEKEIIVVNDGSTDKTSEKLKDHRQASVKVLHHGRNKGKGVAVRTGIEHATGDYILIQDADLEYNPKDIPKLIKPILGGEMRVVYGTRLNRLPNLAKDEKNPRFLLHYFGNRFLSLLTSILYGQWVTDMETGYKLFPKSALADIELRAKSFEFEPEITAKLLKKGFRIIEVPIETNPRGYEEGKKLHTIPDGFLALWTLIRYRVTKIVVILSILLATAFFLRFYLISENLFFGPEQGRDFLVIKDIVYSHKPTLIGPKTDIGGVFHGPIFYYLSAIPFLVSKGDPVFVSGFLIFLNSLTIVPLYMLGRELQNKRTGVIAALLFTFSFGAIVFARWLSNPPLSIPLAVLFFLFLHRFLQGKRVYLLCAAVTFGLLGQVEFINFLIFAVILFGVLIMFRKIFFKETIHYLLLCLLVLATSSWANFLLFDLRHDFLITKSLMALLSGKSGYYVSFASSFFTTMRVFLDVAKTVLAPFFLIPTVIILAGGVVVKKNSLLLLWLLCPIVAFIVLRHDVLIQFFAASIGAIILIGAVFIDFLWTKNQRIGICICLALLGLYLVVFQQNIKENKHVFFQSTQPGLNIIDQKSVIDKIYGLAKGEPFSFQAYTMPFWLQEAWVYLFWQYGTATYGYEPVAEKAPNLFVIIQDDPGNQSYQQAWLKNTVTKWGQEVHEFRIGILRIKQLHVRNL